ncbi:MAG TPA: serine/threonine-protein kinase [Polyangiales bacterium]|nr:serine/threonine-protein kinase [Polyangiales bacterium]
MARWSDYELLELMGEGGTSHVHRARRGDRTRALKRARDPGHSARVQREFTMLSALGSIAGVVRVFESGDDDGHAWYELEALDGGSLRALQRRLWRDRGAEACAGRPELVGAVIHGLAIALHAIHEHGYLHGDLCPGNVLLRGPDEPVLIDFGLAMPWGGAASAGTAGYLAPERLRGEPCDGRADLYALGCIWYELVTGRPVFSADRDEGLHQQHLYGVPSAPSTLVRDFPGALEALLMRLLAKERKQRVARAADIVDALADATGRARAERRVPIVFQPRLVERDVQRATVERALKGASSVLRVSAEPGAGLTRFLDECRARAQALGVRTLQATDHAAGAESGRAQTPALHALRCLDAPFAARVEHEPALEDALRPLVPYFPVLHTRLGAQLPASSREQVFAALWCGLESLARAEPTLVLIDRLEVADALTRGFVSWLRGRGDRLLLLAGSALAPGQTPEADVLLPRLSHAGTSELLADMLGIALEPSLADDAYRFARGLPFAVVELGHWLARHAAAPHASGVHGLLHAQLDALDEVVVQTGAIAALAGTIFSVEDVVALASDPARAALEVLVAQRYLRRDGPSLYFVHEAYRRAFAERVPAESAASLHAERARRLGEAPASALVLREIGQHWLAAGDAERGARALRRASRAYCSALALDDAIDTLEHAWLKGGAERSLRTGLELLRLYGRAARHSRVFALASELVADVLASSLTRSRAERARAISHRMLGAYEAAFAALDRAETALHGARASSIAVIRERIEHAILRSRLHYVQSNARAMWLEVRATLPLARATGRPAQVAALLMDAANALLSRSRYREPTRALRYQRRAVAIYRRTAPGSPAARFAEFDLAFMLLLADRPAWVEAIELLRELERPTRELGDTALSCRIVLYLAIALRRLGDVAACRSESERALQLAQQCGLRGYVGAAHACLGWVLFREGRAELAEERFAEARHHWWSTPRARPREYPFQWLAHAPLIALLVSQERYEECVPFITELLHAAHARLSADVEHALRAAQRAGPDDFPIAVEDAASALRRAGYA